MRIITRYFLIIIIGFLTINFITIHHPFRWLEGIWEMKLTGGVSRLEIWTEKDDNTLTAHGIKVSGKDSVILETIELAYRNDHYWYIPTVPDQNEAFPVPFRLVKEEGMKLTFENPQHDFPQRIIYHLKPQTNTVPYTPAPGDTLFVRVEALNADGIDFKFIRMQILD